MQIVSTFIIVIVLLVLLVKVSRVINSYLERRIRVIRVCSPVFFININNPREVIYDYRVADRDKEKWLSIFVSTPTKDLPKPKEGELFYKFTNERGYLLKLDDLYRMKVIR